MLLVPIIFGGTAQVVGTTPTGINAFALMDYDELVNDIPAAEGIRGYFVVALRTLVGGDTASADVFDLGAASVLVTVSTTSTTLTVVKSSIVTFPTSGQKRYQLRLYAGGVAQTSETTGGGILVVRRKLTGEA